MLDIAQASVGRWHQILPIFGISSKYLTGKHVDECPLCGVGTNRFRWDNVGGRGTYICSSCGAGDSIQLLMRYTGKDFKELANEVRQVIGETTETKIPEEKPKDLKKIRDGIIRILNGCVRAERSRYLENRGINHMPDVMFHPSLEYYDNGKMVRKYPAMVGIVRNHSGKVIGLHRTYIENGEKAPVDCTKKLTPMLEDMGNTAIRLYEASDVLAVCEGIETACSVYELFNIPAWSCVNSSALEKFDPPEIVKKLVIFGDNDGNYSGQKSAYTLAKKLSAKGLDVEVRIPNIVGDFNDLLLRTKS